MMSAITVGTAFAQGPYGGENLPPGVNGLTVDGQTSSLTQTPSTTDTTPTIAGVVDQSGGTIQLGVASDPQTATVSVAANGSFSHVFPQALGAGKHDVFINGVRAGSFNVVIPAPSATPAPPSTGSGDSTGLALGAWIPVGLVLLAGAITASLLLARRRQA